MNLETLNKTVIGWMREIPNPVSGTTADIWCYSDYPRTDISAPRISVTQTGGNEAQAAIGDKYGNTLGVYIYTDYDLDIWVKLGTASTSLNKAGTQLRDYIGDLVLQKIKSKRKTTLRNADPSLDIIDLQVTSVVTQPYMDEFEFNRKTITIRITHVLSYA